MQTTLAIHKSFNWLTITITINYFGTTSRVGGRTKWYWNIDREYTEPYGKAEIMNDHFQSLYTNENL